MRTETGRPGPAFEIDPGKLAEEVRYDGLLVLRTNTRVTVLRTNTRVTPLQAVLRYRDLLQVIYVFSGSCIGDYGSSPSHRGPSAQ